MKVHAEKIGTQLRRLFVLHAEDAHNAAWQAFLDGVPMSWLARA